MGCKCLGSAIVVLLSCNFPFLLLGYLLFITHPLYISYIRQNLLLLLLLCYSIKLTLSIQLAWSTTEYGYMIHNHVRPTYSVGIVHHLLNVYYLLISCRGIPSQNINNNMLLQGYINYFINHVVKVYLHFGNYKWFVVGPNRVLLIFHNYCYLPTYQYYNLPHTYLFHAKLLLLEL